jgi:membrane fusion protein, multidrug efflux system
MAVGAVACGSKGEAARSRRGAMVPVVVAHAERRDVPVDIEAIGNVEAFNTVSVKAQIGGQLTDVAFHEGDFVKAGDRLFTIDPRPYEAALRQAQANLARDQAMLAQAEANLARDSAQASYAQAEAKRYSSLQTRGVISQEQSDQIKSGAEAQAAAVKADQAAIDSAKAQQAAEQATVDTARLQLDYTVIRSPINGRTGNLAVKAGNIIAPNATELTTLAQIQPIYVTFSVPSGHLAAIKQHMAQGPVSVSVAPQDGNGGTVTGTLAFVDNTVDPSTDTIKLKAKFDNPDRRLWPGQFARVLLHLTTLSGAVVVPVQAVQTGQDGQYVFVVKSDQTIDMRPVTPGERANQDQVITRGLQPGEVVVTEGQLRLEPGTHVTIQAAGGPGAGGPPARGPRGGHRPSGS